MADREIIELSSTPRLSEGYRRAALGALPGIGAKTGGTELPEVELVRRGLTVDVEHLGEYSSVCRLRLTGELPVTYPYVLTFPVVMDLMTRADFPLPAMGLVHMENRIEQTRSLTVEDELDVHVHAENLREHPKGLLVDLVSEIRVGGESVWRQVSTFIRKQRTSLSGTEEKKERRDVTAAELGSPTVTMSVDEQLIGTYAACSGDRNPIHISGVGAKVFGFPGVIAHGMWSAAAVLGTVEGRLPAACSYTVRFGRPMVLPARPAVWASEVAGGWDIVARHPKKLYPFLTAEIRGL